MVIFLKVHKCIISGFLAIAISFSLSVSAFAVSPGVVIGAMEVVPDFGSWMWDTAKTGGNLIAGFIDDDYCAGAETSLNGRHDFVPQHTQVNGKTGTFYICKNCGKSAGEVLAPAYDNYVQTLPSTGYTSDGAILWHPTTADVQGYYYAPPLAADFRKTDSLPAGVSALDDKTGYKITGRYTNGELSPSDFNGFGWRVVFSYPVDGLYFSFTSTKVHGAFFYADGSTSTYAENWPQLEFKYHSAGDLYTLGSYRFFTSAFTDSRGVLSYNFSWFFPFFKIIPDAALNDVDYESTDGTAPPGSSSGTDPGEDGESIWDKLGNLLGSVLGGLIGMVNAVLGKILDALTALTDMLMSQLITVVETVLTIFDELPKLFGGFLGFLSAVFPFLPKELMTLLTFGIAAVVFIGILKAVRR